jgi:hypothetical protein
MPFTSQARVVLPAGLEQRELRAAVDLEVGFGIGHRVHVARLPGEIEKKMLPAQKLRQAVPVAHVGEMDARLALEPAHVAAVAAVFRDEAVEQRDLRPELHEGAGEVRADEAESAGDEHALSAESLRE